MKSTRSLSLSLSLSLSALQQTGNEIKRLVATRMICFVMKLSSMVVKSRHGVCKWERYACSLVNFDV